MIKPGDIIRLMHPVGSEEDPSSNSVVIGDIGLVLLVKSVKDNCPGWESPPKIYSIEGDVLVKGKVKTGQAHVVKISEQPEKYF